MNYTSMNKDQLSTLLSAEQRKHQAYVQEGVSLDMSRGKPSKAQLNLSNGLLDMLSSATDFSNKFDYRNYGLLDGIVEFKDIFCQLLNVTREEMIVSGNASLNIMYDNVQRGLQFGWSGELPQNKQGALKWLCPVPGYDRHFAITELMGFEMINIPMTADGPDMDMIEELIANDDTIKGIWCVPKYSNPEGVVYSDEVVRRFASLNPKAKDFRVYWDNAYMVHYVGDKDIPLLDVFAEAKKNGKEDMFFMFGSTSKITFAGAGVSFLAASINNINAIKKLITIQTIGPDKINEYAHALFLKDADGVMAHMAKHAEIMRPKFRTVVEILDRELGATGIATWLNPQGGYFVSCNLMEGTAKRTIALCKQAGVIFTPAGSTYPYKNDPKDSNVRIAPSLPPIEELEKAMEIFCCSAKIASLEKLLA